MQLPKKCGKSFFLSEKAGISVRNKKSCEVRDSCGTVKISFQQAISEGKAQGGRWRSPSFLSEVLFFPLVLLRQIYDDFFLYISNSYQAQSLNCWENAWLRGVST